MKKYTKKWKVTESDVVEIKNLLDTANRKWGKASRAIASYGIIIRAKQLEKFYKEINRSDTSLQTN